MLVASVASSDKLRLHVKPLVNRNRIVFGHAVRLVRLIAAFCLACVSARADTSPPIELERALHLQAVVGDLQGAERILQKLIEPDVSPRRTKAEATFRLAELYLRQGKNDEAKTLLLKFLRDFQEATDLIPSAELELMNVTALLTRKMMGPEQSSMQQLGDLAISLLGALENNERDRAVQLLRNLNSALQGLSVGKDAPEMLVKLKNSAVELEGTLHGSNGGVGPALQQLTKSKDFEAFLQRGFPFDPHDLFAPAWRLKDRLSRALASNNHALTMEIAEALERYLAPLFRFPANEREGTLARVLTYAVRDVRQFVMDGKFPEARRRLDEFDSERHDQFGDFRPVAKLLMRTPEPFVAASYAVLERVDMARQDVSRRMLYPASDHVAEGIIVCREVIPRLDNSDVRALFTRQLEALESAQKDIDQNRLGPALQALKRAAELPQ